MWIWSQTSGPVRHVSLTGCYVTAFDFPTPSDDAVNMVNEVQIYVDVIIKNVKYCDITQPIYKSILYSHGPTVLAVDQEGHADSKGRYAVFKFHYIVPLKQCI